MAGTPANKERVEARVNALVRAKLDGLEEGWDLCETVRDWEKDKDSPWFVADGEKPLSYSQIRRYAVKAEKLISESCRASRKRLLRRHLARRRSLFATAVHQGDVRAALACLDSEAALLGLHNEQFESRLAELEKQASEARQPTRFRA